MTDITTEDNEIKLSESEQADLSRMITGYMPFMEEKGLRSYIYMNDKTNPAPAFLLDAYYRNTFANRIGVMVAKNVKTGEEELLLVGIEIGEDGSEGAFPLARVLGPDAYETYAIPMGDHYSDESVEA